MAPRGLKKTTDRVDPKNDEPSSAVTPADIPLPPDTPDPKAIPSKDIRKEKEKQDTSSPRSSWYNKTWPRKAAPVAKAAEESISTAGDTLSSLASETKTKITKSPPKLRRTPSLALTRMNANSTRSLPADATPTLVNAMSDSGTPKSEPKKDLVEGVGDKSADKSKDKDKGENGAAPVSSSPAKTDGEAAKVADKSDGPEANGSISTATGKAWLGWWSNPAPSEEADATNPPSSQIEASKDDKTKTDPSETFKAVEEETGSVKPGGEDFAKPVDPSTQSTQKRSWLQMWSNTTEESASTNPSTEPATSEAMPATAESAQPAKASLPKDVPPKPSSASVAGSQPGSKAPSIVTSPPPDLPGDGSKSGWIFWSRDRTDSQATSDGAPHIGELAVSDTPSQKKPKRASISLDEGQDKAKQSTKETQKTSLLGKKTKKQSISELDIRPQTPEQSSPTKGGKSTESLLESSKQLQKSVPNVVLPSFRDTFSMQESPTFWQQITRMLSYSTLPEQRHVSQVRDPPRIKNAIAIGVHGYFPAPLIRSVLGQPTGTSIKFADMATKAIRKWTRAHGYDCEVKSAALEGEGRIAERVDILWKLLLNWIEEIRKADFILVACHSQGVPVATMLVSKLIAFGCVNSARVGICAMAGVNLGPFPDYKSRWISGSAGELFEFSNPESTVSKDYFAALETVLQFGVRVSYIGSIDDQLVSMESSTFSPVSHPHIYRAVFVDGRVHAPSFLTHLVGFALKLRNVGVPDHGLIRELSTPLAGSLYTGEGHSRIYEDEAVYDLAVEFALETTSIENARIIQRPTGPSSRNPYILPFAMRGLLEEEYVRTELSNETSELLQQFDDWKPVSKVLQDVKFRLEGIRSKL